MPSKNQTIKLGCVPYFNAKPLIHGIQHVNAGNIRLIYAIPSRLAGMISSGKVDAAMMPCVELARHPEFRHLKGMCISSKGEAESVVFWHRQPMEKLKTVYLDPNSMTSNSLLRVILRKKYGLSNLKFIKKAIAPGSLPAESCGCLMIGDRCLRENLKRHDKTITRMDLGREWHEFTGLPFIFALWIHKKTIRNSVRKQLKDSLQAGLESIHLIAKSESSRLELPLSYCRKYLTRNIRYNLGRDEKKGLKKFLRFVSEDCML
ncbi:MAG: menaquinone biosynthesis protein [Planctomycetes bacterium]|nr:menaquinone biosynthesis protein [Planctomycetota bacterium]